MMAERIARMVLGGVLALVLVVTAAALLPGLWRGDAAAQVIEIHARMPEQGGWSVESLQARTGQPLRLRLTSDDVVHGFAVGLLDHPEVVLRPGKWEEVTLTLDRPGRYTYYCTRWCGANHWRMRGTIEVSGPGPTEPPAGPPLYVRLGIDIDAPHEAEAIPASPPAAERGAALAERIPAAYQSPEAYQTYSPAQLFTRLRNEPGLRDLDDAALWDIVAYLWARQTSPERLKSAAQRYAQNCAACHGETGQGDGVMVAGLPAYDHTGGMSGRTRPPDFTDPRGLLGASPALLKGKIQRGGMGTGMPYWGPLFTEEQMDDLVAYIYQFAWRGRSAHP